MRRSASSASSAPSLVLDSTVVPSASTSGANAMASLRAKLDRDTERTVRRETGGSESSSLYGTGEEPPRKLRKKQRPSQVLAVDEAAPIVSSVSTDEAVAVPVEEELAHEAAVDMPLAEPQLVFDAGPSTPISLCGTDTPPASLLITAPLVGYKLVRESLSLSASVATTLIRLPIQAALLPVRIAFLPVRWSWRASKAVLAAVGLDSTRPLHAPVKSSPLDSFPSAVPPASAEYTLPRDEDDVPEHDKGAVQELVETGLGVGLAAACLAVAGVELLYERAIGKPR